MKPPHHSIKPPQWPLTFLRRFCPDSLYETIEGDLIEQFESDLEEVGEKKAKGRFFWNVLKFIRPEIILRHKHSTEINQLSMVQNYFKIAFRHLLKNKTFSIINITGLAVGMSAAFLILLYVNFEMTYDEFHKNKNEIYRVVYRQYKNGEVLNSSAGNFYGLGQFLKDGFPEVKNVVRLYRWPTNSGYVMMSENKIYNEQNYFFAEVDFFKVFPSLLFRGSAETCLKNPNSIVISERLARKMYGSTDPIGKIIHNLESKDQSLEITGIMRDTPGNAHFDADILLPFEREYILNQDSPWHYPNLWTYITINPDVNTNDFENRLNTSLRKQQRDNKEFRGTRLSLQSLTDIHFTSHLKGEIKPNGNASLPYMLGMIAIVILILAWINYVNLEASRFVIRIREVGIRSVIGSTKIQLVFQFFIQYVCLSTIAIGVAAGIVYTAMPFYQIITGTPVLTIGNFASWIWGIFLLIFASGTIIAGFYPSLLLLRLNPLHALKGKSGDIRSVLIRKQLLLFQLVASTILIAFLTVVAWQLDFMRSINKHVALDRVLTVHNPTNYSVYEDSMRQSKNEAFRNKLLANAGIANLSTSSSIPGQPIGFVYEDLAKRSLNDPDKKIPYKCIFVDYDFIPVFGLKLLAGRNYSPERGEDRNVKSIIVTESAIYKLGFTSVEDAIDREIYFQPGFDWEKFKIIGIVIDYRHESVKTPVYPTLLFLHRNKGQMVYYSALLKDHADPTTAIAFIQKTWQEVWPAKPFHYFFMDEYYDQQYKSEIHFKRIFTLFAGVAIFIALLGILGITLFEAHARLKEISIRKVLGATASNLVVLLSKGHVKLVLLSALLSAPVIYYTASEWLKGYPVRIELSVWIFILPLVAIFMLVMLVSGFQTVRAAHSNPVDHLKDE